MPESAEEWYGRVRAGLAADGPREPEWTTWTSYPLDDVDVRPLEPPDVEREREGAGGVDCLLCERSRRDDPRDYVFWRDEVAMLGAPFQDTALPLVCYLMPRRPR